MQSFELPDFYVPWPARRNPNVDIARVHSKAWAQQVGILGAPQSEDSPNIWSEHDFDRHDYALLCAYIHPETPSPELNLMADWNVWAFYVDDYFFQVYKQSKDHKGAKQYLDRILVFMPVDLSPLPAPTNPMECALADLWLRTAPTKSEAWRGRIIESTKSLLEAFLWELDNLSQQRLANPIEYIEMRRQVGAALWSADLVEHAMFVEVPERIADTRPMRVLKSTFADAVHLRNDIFSYEREVVKQGELTNAVLVMERFLSVDTQHAANLVNDLLTSRLQQFENTAITELVPLFEEYALDPQEQVNVLNYIRGLQDWQSGAHEWHIQTRRYLNPQAKKAPATRMGPSVMQTIPGALGLNRFKRHLNVSYQKVGPTYLPKFYMPFKAQVSPHLNVARQYSKAWARKMGMLDALPDHPEIFICDERKFDADDGTLFNALCHPNATVDELNLDASWMAWGVYTDDYFAAIYGHTHNLPDAKLCYTRLLEFMPLDGVPPATIPLTPIERGLADLWPRTTETLCIDERCLLRKAVESMLGGWLWELSNRVQNRIPDPIDYIEMRRNTSGSNFIIIFSPSAQSQKQGISPAVYRTLTMQQLRNTAIDYVFLTNDIFSYQREMESEGDVHNAVLIIQNFLGCDQIQAIDVANHLMTARIKQFEHLVAIELPVLFKNFDLDTQACEQLLAYAKELEYFMSGSLVWHGKTERYTEIEFRRGNPFTGGPHGLGTAAARILDMLKSDNSSHSVAALPAQAEQEPKDIKTLAVSHLTLPLLQKKEEAQTQID